MVKKGEKSLSNFIAEDPIWAAADLMEGGAGRFEYGLYLKVGMKAESCRY